MNILVLGIAVGILLLGFLYILITLIMNRVFRPTYPPKLRGRLPVGQIMVEKLEPKHPWEVKLQVRQWEPEKFEGKAVLLLHGWESSMGHFATHIEHFREQNYRVIGADLRASGESEYQSFVTVYDYIDDIKHVLRWIRESYRDIEQLVVVAHSLGGVSSVLGMGMEYISTEEIEGLVIEGIYGHASYLLDRVFERTTMLSFLRPLILWEMRRRLRRGTDPTHPLYDTIDDFSRIHPGDHLPDITIPVLSLHAADDRVVDPHHQDLLVEKTGDNVTKVRLAHGGHFKTAHVDGYFDIIDRFLEQCLN